MTSGWTKKQQKERNRDEKHINRLINKKKDFNVVTEEDKIQTFHVIDSF